MKRDDDLFLISTDPAHGNTVGRVKISTQEQLTQAVAYAHRAHIKWAKTDLSQRADIVRQAFDQLHQVEESLTQLISQEMGKDLRRAGYETSGTIHGGAYLAAEVAQALNPRRTSRTTEIQYRPLGVVAVISPWNYPLAMANNLLVPALVAGNSVILKPSEQTPMVADLFVEILNKTLPKGVLQIAHGDGKTGDFLVKQNINMIAFTGSMATGQKIMANAAHRLKRLVMELGGNDPMIVLEDADVFAAARFAVASSFENAGQMCTSTERIYVDDKIASEFEQAVVNIARQYRVGHWQESRVNFGPMASASQHQKVAGHIHDAIEKGAQLLLGEQQPKPPFIQPTVISNVQPEMLLESEETFGPVVAIARFSKLEDAIQRANNSDYGLGAVIFGQQQASAVAQQLQAGMIGINQGPGAGGDTPWVGAKQSGFGYHGSAEGHRQFAQITVVNH